MSERDIIILIIAISSYIAVMTVLRYFYKKWDKEKAADIKRPKRLKKHQRNGKREDALIMIFFRFIGRLTLTIILTGILIIICREITIFPNAAINAIVQSAIVALGLLPIVTFKSRKRDDDDDDNEEMEESTESEEVSPDDDPFLYISKLELTEIVTNVTDYEEFGRLETSIDVYEDTYDKHILIKDFSKELYDKYRKGIVLLLAEQYTEQEIEEHLDDDLLENYIDNCISIGTKVICKELGITAPKNEDKNRGSTLRKTKKWVE